MIRSTLSTGILALVVLWLVLSYLSGTYIALPNISLTALLDATALRWGLVVVLLISVGIQLEIVRATVQKLGKNIERNGSQQLLPLNRTAEGFWAILPLFATIALVVLYLNL